ncbi:hypothetical protein G3N95_26315 [Paraburkholderia sp. Tr-20389]|uniref:hypothetical protein n=1 Tax=Paraburkholderia sp. Tr-20389 TaxID=2703903 RepID=UPI001980354C|nr:hypothetical protein [Paraburkholderia sp. Tr-20389]MBN3756478.1 hypothetical protein [Paraburkholderia sp. Tr-20389]
MDESLRHTLASAFLATGCLFSSASHAYSATEDADAQDREVKAAYDRGYKAAKEELAREAATKGVAAASPDTAISAQKPVSDTPRKPILDIKHVYSETSDIETVQEVPVTSTPLPDNKGTQSSASRAARVAQPQPVARRSSTVATDDLVESDAPQARQPVPRPSAQPRNAGVVRSTGRVQQAATTSRAELAEDEAYDSGMPREAQVYTTSPQYARPRAQYAAPPVPMQPPPQAYGYAQQSAYMAPRPYAYYAPANAWGDRYQPAAYAGRWYWSPEYGRWLYY